MNKVHSDSNVEAMRTWIKTIRWAENDARTDATLNVEIAMRTDDTPEARGAQNLAMLWTKNDFIEFVHCLCEERTNVHTIDAMRIEMDGDTEDTEVNVYAEIHLA